MLLLLLPSALTYSFARPRSILFQRGIYDPDTFTKVQKYGLGMQVTTDVGLAEYLKRVLTQLQAWLERGEVKKLVLVITGVDNEEVLERSDTQARSRCSQS